MVWCPEDFDPVLRKWQNSFLLDPQLLKKPHNGQGVVPVPPWEPKYVRPYGDGHPTLAPGDQQPANQNSLWETSKSLWKTYCKNSTFHGIRFAAADDASNFVRIFWACALIGATITAVYICQNFFEKVQKLPINIRVAEDHVDLQNVVFPAVVICPTNRVRLSVAREYIYRELEKSQIPAAAAFLKLSNVTHERQIKSFVTAMSHFELQALQTSERLFNRSQRLLAALAGINITDFMLQTLPECKDLVSKCEWHGVSMDCCKDFLLQQSPIGFCYSFNSLSSIDKKFCNEDEGMTVEQSTRRSLSADNSDCRLRRTTGFGMGSGLRIRINKLKKEYEADGVEELIMVALHSPVRYPKAGSFSRIRPNGNQNLAVAISLENTAMSEEVGLMEHEVTECIGGHLPDSLKPTTLNIYTHSTCTLECRLHYMKQKCGCYPYFLGGEPQCKSTDLIRCIRTCRQIHWQIPPERPKIEENFGTLDQNGINCTRCIRRCQTLAYYPDFSIRYTTIRSGTIDVFYRDLTAAKLYRVDRRYASVDIATYLGSIAGLCLGCSILTMVEITFYLMKFLYLAAIHYGGLLDAVSNQRDKKKYNFRFKRR